MTDLEEEVEELDEDDFRQQLSGCRTSSSIVGLAALVTGWVASSVLSHKVLRSAATSGPLFCGVTSCIVASVTSYFYCARQWMKQTPAYKNRSEGSRLAEDTTKYGDNMSK